MRKLRVFFVFLSLCAAARAAVFFPAVRAYAASGDGDTYARVLSDEVYFLNGSGNALFLLPLGYYVKITEETETHYKVEYLSHPGLVSKADIMPSETPSALYPLYPEVSVSTLFTTLLKTGADASSADTPAGIIPSGETLLYYGSLSVAGALWHYVRYGNYLGYMPSAAVTAPVVPEHPLPLPKPPEPPPEPAEPNKEEDDTTKWILIAGISVPAVIIVILLFQPKKTQTLARTPSFMEEFDDIDDL